MMLDKNGIDDFGLAKIQKDVLRLGRAHFDPDGRAPLGYFKLLLYVGLFEKAIAFLIEVGVSKCLWIDAVHVALALVATGIVDTTLETRWITYEGGDSPYLAGKRSKVPLLSFLTEFSFFLLDNKHTEWSLTYVISSSICAGRSSEYRKACVDLLVAWIVKSRNFHLLAAVLPDGEVEMGDLVPYLRLFYVDERSNSAAMKDVALLVAESVLESGGEIDTVLGLFHIGGDFGRVFGLLAQKLSDDLELLQAAPKAASLSVRRARDTLAFYGRHAKNADQITVAMRRVSLYLVLIDAFQLFHDKRYDATLRRLAEGGVLNLETMTLNELFLDRSDVLLGKHVASILDMTMKCVAEVYTSSRGDREELRRTSRGIVALAGRMLPNQKTSMETLSRLTRIDASLE